MPGKKSFKDTICILPEHKGIGGPASFRARIITGLEARGYSVHSNPLSDGTLSILVIGGTRRLDLLWAARQRGIRIVQRLNGMNWVHRKTRTGFRHFMRSEINNWILATIRRSLADEIIYQSQFTQDWWNEIYGTIKTPASVIYNGVDLAEYSPSGKGRLPVDRIRILVIEGRFEGGYHVGLQNAVNLANSLRQKTGQKVELMVVGDAPERLRSEFSLKNWITWKGVVAREQIPELCRSSHLLFSADIKAACPNSVIEALSCGLPVISYDTGALKEMVGDKAGAIRDYGADFSELEPAKPDELSIACLKIIKGLASYRRAAREQATSLFDVDQMVDDYLEILVKKP